MATSPAAGPSITQTERTRLVSPLGLGLAREWRNGFAVGGILDETFEASKSRLLFLRTDDPPGSRLSIPGRLILKESPGFLIGLQVLEVARRKLA